MAEPFINNRLIEALVSYLPPAVTRQIHDHPDTPIEPRAANFPAAVLFTDVSGFTALTEGLAAHGPAGAEELTLLLNGYFSRMIGLLEEQGGEVVQFSGDALTAVFPADDRRPTTDDRRPTTDRPPTTDHRPPTTDQQSRTTDQR